MRTEPSDGQSLPILLPKRSRLMEFFTALISSHTEWLVERAHFYFVARGYERHFAHLPQCWLPTISQISAALTDLLRELPSLEEQNTGAAEAEPAASFTSTAILLCRQHQAPMELFFGLLKELRQGYLDLLRNVELEQEQWRP